MGNALVKGTDMNALDASLRIAVVGAGIAGSACASSLQRAGMRVTLFDKSRGAGGRMATRRAQWTGADGAERVAEFDHGAPCFTAEHPRFRALMARAEAVGCVARWQPRVHDQGFAPLSRSSYVAVPTMSALCRHLLAGVELSFEQPVQRLQRHAHGWQVVVEGRGAAGPFDQVIVALPAPQAALLLAGHQDRWADALSRVATEACWTLMAVTDDVDWPRDAAQLTRGPVEWVIRNDRKPGRHATPGCASWVVHASPAWSQLHLEDDPAQVSEALSAALAAALPRTLQPIRWHHAAVHRWRHALATGPLRPLDECWWDPRLGLGVCGDHAVGASVESAWRCGDELADTVLAGIEVVAA